MEVETTIARTAHESTSNLARLREKLIAIISWQPGGNHRDLVIGQVMTLLEASIPDMKQCEAAKSIAKSMLHRTIDDLSKMVGGTISSLAQHQGDEAYFDEGWERPGDSKGIWA